MEQVPQSVPAGQYQLFAEIQDTIAGVTYTRSDYARGSITVQLANPTPTTTTTTNVYSSLDPSTYGQSVTYTAIVSSGAGIPTGNVLFYTGGPQVTVALNNSGVASLTPPGTLLDSADPANDWGVTAIYQGNATYKSSRGSIDQTIDQAPTWTTLSSSMNLSAYGQSVTFTATLTPAEPLVSDFAGAYELFVDGQLAASGPMKTAAQFSWTTSKLSRAPTLLLRRVTVC